MQLIQVILQCHCNNDLKNMHSMLFLKSPACSRNDPYPHHERDLPHATPPPPPPPSYPFGFFRKAPVPIHTLLPS